jgi:putative ABC transport system permease protein
MRAIGKLTTSMFATRKVRSLLTVLAIAMAVSLVVAVTGGYASAKAAILRYLVEYMGSTDVEVKSQADYRTGVPESIADLLANDGRVRSAVGRLEIETDLVHAEGKGLEDRFKWGAGSEATPAFGQTSRTYTLTGVVLPDDVEVDALKMEPGTTGGWFHGRQGNVAVVDQEAAKYLGVEVGGRIVLPSPNRTLTLTIVGIVHKPTVLATLDPSIYVPLQTLQEYADARERVTRVVVDLRHDTDDKAFVERWREELTAIDPALRITSARDSRNEMEQNFRGIELLSYLGSAISLLAATFIIFSTLSMGVMERQRTLAMLRAVGALRWQIGGLVVLEGLVLAVMGIILGVPLGCLWVKALAVWKSDIFQAGAVYDVEGMIFGAVAAMAAALVASLLPAIGAMRLSPLDGLTAQGRPGRRMLLAGAAAAGLVLIAVDPLLLQLPGLPDWAWFYGHFVVGLPCLMVGFFLLSPVFIWVVEKTAGRILALVLGVRYGLLSQQLTGSIWRAAGTGAALMVGLAILVVMHTRGTTLLSGWRLPDKFPDMFIWAPLGLKLEQVATIEAVEGIRKGEVLPIGIGVSGLRPGFWGVLQMGALSNSTMFVGIEPEKALQMMGLEFREGSEAEATRLLKQGRHVIITEELHQLKGLGVGDKLPLRTAQGKEVDYTVAAVVWSPGIDVFVSMFDLRRQMDERTVSSVFGSLEDARRDFGVERINLFAVNLSQYGLEREVIEERLRQKLWAIGLRAGDVRQIKHNIQQGLKRLLMLLSTLALAAIAVASLGVTNTIMASIRTRQWQLGVLRSVGLTRWQLLRLILAEAVLLGLVGAALGVAAGLEMSLNAHTLDRKVIGYAPPIVVPWDVVRNGVWLILGVAVVASLWPAISAARQEPLALLQSGRSGA